MAARTAGAYRNSTKTQGGESKSAESGLTDEMKRFKKAIVENREG